MGCAQSTIENEESVSRCKDRKQFMKEALAARSAFAAAHSAYAMSLKNTGAGLSDYAHGEVQLSSSSSPSSSATAVLPTTYDSLLPPPPVPNFTSPPLHRAATMPEFAIPKSDIKHSDAIVEDENEDKEIETESAHSLKHRVSKSTGGSSRGRISRREVQEDKHLPSPPSPPPSTPPKNNQAPPLAPAPTLGSKDTWDYFFPSMENVPGPNLVELEENRVEREEIERKVFEESSTTNIVDGGGRKTSTKVQTETENPEEIQPPATLVKTGKRVKHAVDGKRKGASSLNLLQVFAALDDCFLKASESAHEVSKMLEANRLHYHSNFADNRGHIDHSARVMRVITWNRSFKGLPNANGDNDNFDSEQNETHATVLDKMLAWEKKLYEEVKVGEQMKLEYQRKLAALNKLQKHKSSTEALEKMKAAVSHLHTRYIVDMQSMDSTASEINRLRDKQLYPKLVALVDGMATMWTVMREQHENQLRIVQALKSFDISQSSKETTEHHHERTIQLWSVAQEWHSQFEKLVTHQKLYVSALRNWLKLNLIPIDNNLKEKVSSPERPHNTIIQILLNAWHDNLEKLPDELAKTAIFNFAAVVQTIMQHQADEMKLRHKCEDTRRELTRKTRQFEDWERKYMQRRTPPDEMDPDRAHDKGLIAERKGAVEAVSIRLQEEEEAYHGQRMHVREKSLTSLKTRLPEIFRAMSEFSRVCSDMYVNLRSISQHTNPNGGPPHGEKI